uniref:ATP synthase F0 subunit 8 n=1 Tax=Brasilocerus sp. 2 DTA-2012 TaxID=1176494 RepID=A0A0H3UL18_9COLE|nr:ATP synthase F0 subunit 8 [Brasilocerus sp. 2 DTA-2012]
MPHMSPLWWLNLLILFTLMFLATNSTIYSMFLTKNKPFNKMEKEKKAWKW